MFRNWNTVIRPKKGWFDIDLRGVVQYRDLIWMMIKRNFTIMYRQTILGPAWVIIQPLLTTLIFTVVFGSIAGLPTDGLPHLCSTWPAASSGTTSPTA